MTLLVSLFSAKTMVFRLSLLSLVLDARISVGVNGHFRRSPKIWLRLGRSWS